MKLLIGLLLTVLAYSSFASIPIGFHTKEIYESFKSGEARLDGLEFTTGVLSSTLGNLSATSKLYQVYDLNVTATLAESATVAFTAQPLPADAIITNSYYEVQTVVESVNDNTIAFACGTVDLLTAADLTDVLANTIAAGDITGAAATYANTGAAACVPTITIGAGVSGVTDGRVRFFVEYVLR